jgi:Periplasmic protease
MGPRYLLISALLFGLALGAVAQSAPTDPPITAAAKADVIQALGQKLKSNYVFPDVAERTSAALDANSTKGSYANANTSKEFAKLLTNDLRTLGNDRHLVVRYAPDATFETPGATPSPHQLAKIREEVTRDGFGIARVERLPGNVGYLDLRGFGPTEMVGDAYTSAVALLAGTDALILDLRRNGGGEPASVAWLMSHFFAEGDERHINDIYERTKDQTRQYWTSASVKTRYLKPVYVLVSGYTFSGGEECAYDFQTQKRGTLVGETTGGGANPGDFVALGHGFAAFIPDGRAINPITKTNWEHVGVKPDVTVPAAKAQQTAYAEILRTLIAEEKDSEARQELNRILARVEKGDSEKVEYPAGR